MEKEDERLKVALKKLNFSVYDKDMVNFKNVMKKCNISVDDLEKLTQQEIDKMKDDYLKYIKQTQQANMPILEFLDRFDVKKTEKESEQIDSLIQKARDFQNIVTQKQQKYLKDHELEKCGPKTLQDQLNLEMIQYKLNDSIFEQYLRSGYSPTLFLVPQEFLQKQNDFCKISCFGNAYDKYLFNHWMFFRNFFPHNKKYEFYNPISPKQFIDIMFGICDEKALDNLSKKYDIYLRDYQSVIEIIQTQGPEVGEYYNEKISYYTSLFYQYAKEIFNFKDKLQNEILKSALCTVLEKLQKYRQSLFFILLSCIQYTLIFIDMQSYDINEDKVKISHYIPQSIISEMYDPMLDKQFQKYKDNDKDERKNAYNRLISELPIWDVLDQWIKQKQQLPNVIVDTSGSKKPYKDNC